ncbi:MAG: ABC transporter permease [Candidatus Azobacteroides sp.]|nr:ABC transporter permease [Candidatus Azobacteroides sp.]
MSTENKVGLLAVISRELNRIVSRRIYLVTMIAIPLFAYIFFITMFSEGLPQKLPIAVIDNDNTTTSRTFIRQLNTMQMVNVTMYADNFDEAQREMRKGNIYAFVIIPLDMESDLQAGRQPELTFYYNNAFFIPGALLYRDLSTMSALTSASVGLKTGLAKGKTAEELMGQLQPIVLDSHLIGNPYTNYSVYLSNVLMPGILQLMILLITVFAIGIELKEGTGREWLATGGRSVFASVAGKLFPYTFTFTTLVIFQNVILFRMLGFPLHTNISLMIAASVLFVLATQAIGIFLIGLLPVLRNALSFSAVFGILGVSFSGFTFPVEQMPPGIQSLTLFFPMQHFFRIYENSALAGAPIYYYWHSYLFLLSFMLLPFIVMLRLKKALIFENYPKK